MESARANAVEYAGGDGSLVVAGRPIEASSLSLLADGRDDDRPWVVWHGPGERVTGLGSAATITATGPDRFETVRHRARELFANRTVSEALPAFATPRLFGGFAFHDGGDESHGEPDWGGYPDARFVLPSVAVIERDGEQWLTAAAVGPEADADVERTLDRWQTTLEAAEPPTATGSPGILARTQLPDRGAWTKQVRSAVERVARGDLRKVVLAGAQSVQLADTLSVPDAIDRLGSTYPDCYRFALRPDDSDAGTFFGATPERLVARRGRTVETAALAGSTGRGETNAEDEWLAEQLHDSEKDSHEHALVVEAIREQLDGVAETVATGERSIRQLATVQHLRTPIQATLAEDIHVLSLVAQLHPTPAVGGLPPNAALSAIRDAEAFDRGWYAAPIGWFDAAGDGTFAVGIRSALARDQQATLFAGAGIVADSDPDEEWDEIQLKYQPIIDALR
ncbi:isochorismate synthase [Halorhabdus sp. CBA1104]|uniref:isochorismate synthase n=1 Tax=unclassified Halorhabdus TaxID=2621901 RepID=UPI0012B2C200|nr:MULTISPECIES: isochorismate synthase [unclassified Halorhabdus]QGN06999.1 isochorismate synthase [Halorhabdus sp. CBA1104]